MEFPDRDELVIVVIRKIVPYGAFCTLPEYNNLESFLHVSEVAPRWIKNIHEFISEGQQHVAKVSRIDREKNQIDVSQKRVSEEEKKRKLETVRTGKRAEKLLNLALKNSGAGGDAAKVIPALELAFGDVWSAFLEAFERGEGAFADVDIPKALKAQIVEIAHKNIKKPTVEVGGTISLTCWGDDGISEIKKVLQNADKDAQLHYMGAPKYKLTLSAPNYKEGEKKLNDMIKRMETLAHENSCDFSFQMERA